MYLNVTTLVLLFITNRQTSAIFLQLTKHISIFIFLLRYSATVGGRLRSNQGGRVRRWLVHFTNNPCQQLLLDPNEKQVRISHSIDQ